MKIIQTQTTKITKVRRLSSEDIRMHMRFKKTKIELHENKKRIKKIIVSATCQEPEMSERKNGRKTENQDKST